MRLITYDVREFGVLATQNRSLNITRPCECGCDERTGPTVGYMQQITDGLGFSLHAETEDEYLQLWEMLAVLLG